MMKNWRSLKLVQMGQWLRSNKMEPLRRSTTQILEIHLRSLSKPQRTILTESLVLLMKVVESLTGPQQLRLLLSINELLSERLKIEIESLSGTVKLGGKSSLQLKIILLDKQL